MRRSRRELRWATVPREEREDSTVRNGPGTRPRSARAGRHSVPRVRSIPSPPKNWVPRAGRLVRTGRIVSDVAKVREFYRAVFPVDPVSDVPESAEFELAGGGLARFDLRGQEALATGSADPGTNRCSRIEVEGDDVDREYARLGPLVTDGGKPPTTPPGGSGSAYFRDPEGNLGNFFTRANPSPARTLRSSRDGRAAAGPAEAHDPVRPEPSATSRATRPGARQWRATGRGTSSGTRGRPGRGARGGPRGSAASRGCSSSTPG